MRPRPIFPMSFQPGLRGCAAALAAALFSHSACAAGCAELYRELAFDFGHEIASKTSLDPAGAARDFVRYKAWAAMAGFSLDALEASPLDRAAGEMLPMPGYPEGASACMVLARRKAIDGTWPAKDLAAAVQAGVDALALIDWSLSSPEVSRMNARAKAGGRVGD